VWIPESAAEVEEAARRGDLEETHTFDAKAALPGAKSGGPNVDAELEKRGFEVVSCEEAGELIFSCQLESGRRVQALVHEGKVFVVKAV
jgi:hypothetical protein